jgi:hypothetical protein
VKHYEAGGAFVTHGIREKHKMKVVDNLKRVQCEDNIKIILTPSQNDCKDLVQLAQVSDIDGCCRQFRLMYLWVQYIRQDFSQTERLLA